MNELTETERAALLTADPLLIAMAAAEAIGGDDER